MIIFALYVNLLLSFPKSGHLKTLFIISGGGGGGIYVGYERTLTKRKPFTKEKSISNQKEMHSLRSKQNSNHKEVCPLLAVKFFKIDF